MDALSELLSLSTEKQETLGLKHTLAEIVQQPQTWLHTYRKIVSLSEPLDAFLSRLGIKSNQSTTPPAVLLVGAGTSDYIGRSVCSLLQNEWCCDVHATPSTDLLTNMPEHVIPCREYLWISFSRSGDSSEGVAVLEAALRDHPRIKHLVITCNAQGRMASAFDRDNVFRIVLDDDVNDRGLAMTSSFSNMVITAQALAHIRTLSGYRAVVENLATSAATVLPAVTSVCERIVDEGFSRVCFLGTGPLKAAAIESGLKVVELTGGRVVALTESFLGLRHGPLSAIDRHTLVIGFLSANDRRRAFELDLLQEICDKKLTEKCVIVAPTPAASSCKNQLCLNLPETISDLYLPPLFVLVGQLLALAASLREGLRPDEPSPHGAISRVVTHVTIH